MLNNEFKIILYDVSLPLEERKKKAIIYPSVKKASAVLNFTPDVIKTIIKRRERIYIERLNKTVAIRHI